MIPLCRTRPIVFQIDDNEGDLELGRLAVEDCCDGEVEYRGVADSQQALRLLAELAKPGAPPLALLIVDVNLPRIDGWQIVQFITANAVLRAAPLVVFSGSSNSRDLARARAARVQYRIKPPTYTELSRIIRDLIRGRIDRLG
jgi:chemotaxis family two-component system response regulator Rcp1